MKTLREAILRGLEEVDDHAPTFADYIEREVNAWLAARDARLKEEEFASRRAENTLAAVTLHDRVCQACAVGEHCQRYSDLFDACKAALFELNTYRHIPNGAAR